MLCKRFFLFGILTAVFLFAFCFNLSSYPLLDPDETRYVDMAKTMFNTKEYLTLYLNGEFFFEKPPLFFWVECLSFKFFNNISEFTSRFPIVLISLIPAFLLFNLSSKVKDLKFAFITTLILFTSLEYIILTKMAILDSLLTSFTVSSVLCYFYTHFVQKKDKKYFWISAYVFCGLGILAKGVPAFVVPSLVVFISSFVFKTWKETFKYLPLGVLLIGLVALPWHIAMFKLHNPLFFDEYVMKHHILRFLGSDVINRKQPFYFYILTILWGVFPYIFSLIFDLFNKTKNILKTRKISFNLETDFDKFYLLNVISFLAILFFFSLSGTKLVTYILPLYPFLSVILGKIWYDYIVLDLNEGCIKKSILVLNGLLVITYIASLFAYFYLPSSLYYPYIEKMQLAVFALFNLYFIFAHIGLDSKNKLMQFLNIVFFMAIFSTVFTPLIFKFDYALGQDDLMKFAKLAKENNYTISTYRMGKKYALLYYSDLDKIDFHQEDSKWFNEELLKPNNYLIVKNNKFEFPEGVKPIIKGVKYSIVGKVK